MNKFSTVENLIKTDNYNSHNQGWFQIANRLIVYGSFEYQYGVNSIQNFTLSLPIPNWQNANVITSSLDTVTNNVLSSMQARLTSATTLTVKAANAFNGKGLVSYLIIARIWLEVAILIINYSKNVISCPINVFFRGNWLSVELTVKTLLIKMNCPLLPLFPVIAVAVLWHL